MRRAAGVSLRSRPPRSGETLICSELAFFTCTTSVALHILLLDAKYFFRNAALTSRRKSFRSTAPREIFCASILQVKRSESVEDLPRTATFAQGTLKINHGNSGMTGSLFLPRLAFRWQQ
jgi:hypothetical protein